MEKIVNRVTTILLCTGRALTIRHYRPRQDCGSDVVWEELEPVDQNLNYDFNYQQFTHLRKEHVVLPVSTFECSVCVSYFMCVS